MEEIERILLEEARTDTVGVWAVLWEIRQMFEDLSPEEARARTLNAIDHLLGTHRVVAGQFTDQDENTLVFERWDLPAKETVSRIDREWKALGRDPNPGEIAWLVDPGLLPLTALRHPMGKGWKPPR